MESLRRPNRSDEHLSMEEEERIKEETQERFDSLAPKRHTKPQRSEYSSSYVDVNDKDDNIIPEYAEFQRLENEQEKLEYQNGGKATEEFVETEYYKDLNCVNKQHHTTGTGFIKIEDGSSKLYGFAPDMDFNHHASGKGNPATNDWLPAIDDQNNYVSDKPNRSEN